LEAVHQVSSVGAGYDRPFWLKHGQMRGHRPRLQWYRIICYIPLVFCLGRFCVVSGQTNSTILSRTLPLSSDEGAVRERISTIIHATIKQGEGYTVEGVKFWTRIPPSTKDVEEIKAYGEKAVPILEEYLFSDVGLEGALALEILGRLGGSQIVEPLKRVVEQSTSASRRQLALSWLTQAPWELALPIIRNAAETDRDPEVRAVARDLLVQYSPKKQ
jgi:hypothetical protein